MLLCNNTTHTTTATLHSIMHTVYNAHYATPTNTNAGCWLDMDQPRALGFTLNGRDVDVGLGLAFEELRCAGGLYPCASFNRKEKLRFNFGDAPWAHPPPAGFRPYIEAVRERCAEYTAACALAGLVSATAASASGSGSGADARPFWLEDSLEEQLGEESYRADTRYFLPDSAAGATASTTATAAAVDTSSTVRSSRQPNTATTAVTEKLQLRDEDVSQMCATHDELLGVSLELAALYARRAALLLLARWPVQRPFTLAELAVVPATAAVDDDSDTTTTAGSAAMITTVESMEDAAISIVRLLVLAGAESSTAGVAQPTATATTAATAAAAAATEGLALGSSGYSEVPVQQLKAALCAGGALALNAVAPAVASAVSAARTAASTAATAGGNSDEGLLLLDKLVACVAQQVLLAAHREYAPSAAIDSSGRQSRLQSLAAAGAFDAGHHRSGSGASSSVNHRSSGFSSAAASLTEVSVLSKLNRLTFQITATAITCTM
jgi:trimeric autotransporter adhesin